MSSYSCFSWGFHHLQCLAYQLDLCPRPLFHTQAVHWMFPPDDWAGIATLNVLVFPPVCLYAWHSNDLKIKLECWCWCWACLPTDSCLAILPFCSAPIREMTPAGCSSQAPHVIQLLVGFLYGRQWLAFRCGEEGRGQVVSPLFFCLGWWPQHFSKAPAHTEQICHHSRPHRWLYF